MQELTVKVMKVGDRDKLVMYYIDPVTEKRVVRSTKETDPKKAERKAQTWEDELKAGSYLATKALTWQAFRERFEREHAPTLSPHTQASVTAAFNHLEALLNPKKLGSLTAGTLSRFQTALRNYRRKVGKGDDQTEEALTETSIGAYLGHLRAALGWAVKMKLLRESPQIEMPKQAKGRTMMRGRPITGEEFDRMIEAVPSVRKQDAADWVHFLKGLWLSGLRLEESTIVSWDPDAAFSIDLSGRRPRFRIYAEAHKGRRDQYLPMTPDFAEFILATAPEDRHGLLFQVNSQTTGKPMSVKRICRAIGEIGEKAGAVVNKDAGKFATAHDLRRAFGSRWARKVAPAILQQLMRHRSIETTMKYYVELDADEVSDQLWVSHNSVTNAQTTTKGETETTPSEETEAVDSTET